MAGEVFVGVFLVIVGGFMALRADLMMRFQIWGQRVLMGAQYIPSERTYIIMRVVGALIVVMGLIVLVANT